MTHSTADVEILGELKEEYKAILTPEALDFIAQLHRKFNPTREALLKERESVQEAIFRGELPEFPKETHEIRNKSWRVAEAPHDLNDRRVEITGPVERKMMINALNSGAKVFMADIEDSLSPTWQNVIEGQINLRDAVRHKLEFKSNGKEYRLKDESELATLVVRPRGWHLPEKHITIDGKPVSGSLFDFGMYFFHNAKERLSRKTAPYFYLPKMESYKEARLWNDVFVYSQNQLGIPQGSIRATVLIETILASLQMEEILFELKDHMAGLNAGRWDYIFSAIKKFRKQKGVVFPDRAQVSMGVPFMHSYAELLVHTCHKRGAHAIGGMAAFIPSRKDPKVNEIALGKVREDKERESRAGFDGTWVAHPDLVPVAKEVFDRILGDQPNQKSNTREDVSVSAKDLLNFTIPGSQITDVGVTNNISVALQYLNWWLQGLGAVAIYNLMEDAATAEISRAQLWQWLHQGVQLEDGRLFDGKLYETIRDAELSKLGGREKEKYRQAAEVLDRLVLDEQFVEFLTLPAYELLK